MFGQQTAAVGSSKPVCKYFVKGKCKYGTQCWNYHPPNQGGNTMPNSFLGGSSNVFGGGKANTQQEAKNEFQDFVKQVSGEMTQWERSGQWLVSSFSPLKGHPPFSGFHDTSPEEFRLKAYEALKTNTSSAYQAHWSEMQQRFKQFRDAIKTSTPEAFQAMTEVFFNKNSTEGQPEQQQQQQQQQAFKQPGMFEKPTGPNVFGGASQSTSGGGVGLRFLNSIRMSGYQRRDHGGGGSRYSGNRSDDTYYGSDSRRNDSSGGGGQPRGYRPSNPRTQIVSPWESGMAPMTGGMNRSAVGGGYMHSSSSSSSGGGGGGRLSQDIVHSISQLNQMGNPESQLALNVISAVLTSSGMDTGADQGWSGGPRPNKMRRVDWGEGYEGQRAWTGMQQQQQQSRGQQHRGYSGNTSYPSRRTNNAPRRNSSNSSSQQKRKSSSNSGATKQTQKNTQQDKEHHRKKNTTSSSGEGGEKTQAKDHKKMKDEHKKQNETQEKKKKTAAEEEKTGAGGGDEKKKTVGGGEEKKTVEEEKKKTVEGGEEKKKTVEGEEKKIVEEGEEKKKTVEEGEEKKKTGGEEDDDDDDNSTVITPQEKKEEEDNDDKQSDTKETEKENKDDERKEDKKNDNEEKEMKKDVKEKETKNEKEASKENDGETEMDIPPEALSCHICMRNFKTLNGFQSHVNGKLHDKIYKTYMQKCNAMLNVVQAHSKLDSQRKIVSLRNVQGRITACNKCSCPIKGGMATHAAMRQHALVCNFNNCSMCKKKFTSRMKYESHCLSLPHLKRQYELKKRNEEKAIEKLKKCTNKYDFPELELARHTHKEVEKARMDNYRSQVFTPGSIPAYDPGVPIGMNFLEKVSQLYCTICSKRILQTAKGALAHFRSEKHYENYLNYLKRKEGIDVEQEDEDKKKDNEHKEEGAKIKDEENDNEKTEEGKNEMLPEGNEEMKEGEGKHDDKQKVGHGEEKKDEEMKDDVKEDEEMEDNEKEDVEMKDEEEKEEEMKEEDVEMIDEEMEDKEQENQNEDNENNPTPKEIAGLSELKEVGESFVNLDDFITCPDTSQSPTDDNNDNSTHDADVEDNTSTPADGNEVDPLSIENDDDIPSHTEQDSHTTKTEEAVDSTIPSQQEPDNATPEKPSDSNTSTTVTRRAVKRGLPTSEPETVNLGDTSEEEEVEPTPITSRTSTRRGRGRGRGAKARGSKN
ncbi:hypothetical protein Pcinc_017701 [Petrolisthes cinctipes]|uniref:Nucleoporin NUP42 n=1 Tax=Petrolisthes cinctipes TaxID=88211 RepID=A0AAE1FPR3_PETCI|nr:hypothetical protein Pcinc_017701 [Petrolisthes cinctipes]